MQMNNNIEKKSNFNKNSNYNSNRKYPLIGIFNVYFNTLLY